MFDDKIIELNRSFSIVNLNISDSVRYMSEHIYTYINIFTYINIYLYIYIHIYIYTYIYIWLVIWKIIIFPSIYIYIFIGNNHPSWLSYFSERWLNHQPLYNSWWSHFLRGGGCPAHAARSGGAAGVEDMGELHQLVSRNQLIRILKTMVISRVFTCYISYILWHPKGKIMSLLGHIILYPKN